MLCWERRRQRRQRRRQPRIRSKRRNTNKRDSGRKRHKRNKKKKRTPKGLIMDEWNLNSTFSRSNHDIENIQKSDYGWKRPHLILTSIEQSIEHQKIDYGWKRVHLNFHICRAIYNIRRFNYGWMRFEIFYISLPLQKQPCREHPNEPWWMKKGSSEFYIYRTIHKTLKVADIEQCREYHKVDYGWMKHGFYISRSNHVRNTHLRMIMDEKGLIWI
jgi:hypothetical protein